MGDLCDDGLDFCIITEGVLSIFTTETGHFVATEWNLWCESIVAVDPAGETQYKHIKFMLRFVRKE